jgi:OFA family oxalate/formate antiporter-like MFS transporter
MNAPSPQTTGGYRWLQLVMGIVCMVMIANLQYGWTFFVAGIQKQFGWERATIQVAFTLFVLFETWLVPIEGWLVDKFGPRIVVLIGGVLCGIGWVTNSYADSLTMFYVAQIVSGIGAGAVYGTCVGNALKWFPDRRGLAAGLTAAGFGMGSAFTVKPIQAMIEHSGIQATFFNFGVGQGVIVCLFALFLAAPKAGQVPEVVRTAAVIQGRRQFSPSEIIGPNSWWIGAAIVAAIGAFVLSSLGLALYIPLMLAAIILVYGGWVVWTKGQPIFTLMYLMFVLVATGGLIVTANLAPIAGDLKVAKIDVTLLGWTLPALTFAASLDRVLNGLTRPFFGWVSDHIGRENTMFIAFFLEGVGIFALYELGSDPVWFVMLSGIVFFAWGEIYSLFPSTATDTFGVKFATANAGLLYTAKGTAALLVPYSNSIHKATGTWDSVFIIAAVLNILAAVLALVVLKPWRTRVLAPSESVPAGKAQPA